VTELIGTIADLRTRLAPGRPRVVVMTMGALHEGHLQLMRAAREWAAGQALEDAELVVTIFVNPLQFNNADDLARYPRTLESDVAMCAAAGVDVVFAPTAHEMYPNGDPMVTVDPGALGDVLEGSSRPGHFRGMLTVVNRLLMITTPTAAMFGEKDYQQLTLIRQMVRDLLIPVEIVAVPTVREPDGLAMSSRNRRLSESGRAGAVAVPQALAMVKAGSTPEEAAAWLADQPAIEQVDYLVVRSTDLSANVSHGPARVLVAAVVDGVRLLDNEDVTIGDRT